MNEKQKKLLQKIMNSPRGTVLRKGKTERVLWGFMPGFIAYKTKRSRTKVSALNIQEFIEWAEKAEFVK